MAEAAILYGTLAVCALLVGLMIYRYDLYDKEPWYMVLIAVALGAGMMWCIGPLEMFTMRRIGELGQWDLSLAVVAATHEGLGKFIVVLLIALLFRRAFNDPADGIIYGSLVGLGAALTESIGQLRYMDSTPLLPPQEVVRLLGHAVFGGITGYGLGAIVIRCRGWLLFAAGTLVLAIALHLTWDILALTQPPRPSVHSFGGAAVMFTGLLLYGTLVARAARESRRHFQAPGRRLFGWPFGRLSSDHDASGATCIVLASPMSLSDEPSPVRLEYKAHDPGVRGRAGPVAWLLATSGAICTFAGLAAASAVYPRWLVLSSARAYERTIILGVVLVALLGMPLALGALLLLRRSEFRAGVRLRRSHPVALIALATLVIPALVAMPLRVVANAPQLTAIFAWALVLLALASAILARRSAQARPHRPNQYSKTIPPPPQI